VYIYIYRTAIYALNRSGWDCIATNTAGMLQVYSTAKEIPVVEMDYLFTRETG